MNKESNSFTLDGLLAIVFFAVLPGLTILLWGNERGLVAAITALSAYYCFCWFFWHSLQRPFPLIAPGITLFLGILRAYGYGLAYVDRWWTTGDPLSSKKDNNFFDMLCRYRKSGTTAKEDSLSEMEESNTAFISYRYEGGAETARLIYSSLKARGVKAFLDKDDLRPSRFDEKLLLEIERAPNFILILSSGALDRCGDKNDWVRYEIEHAIKTERNIIPILKKDFAFPTNLELPQEIAELSRYHAIMFSNEFYDAMIDKIITYLK